VPYSFMYLGTASSIRPFQPVLRCCCAVQANPGLSFSFLGMKIQPNTRQCTDVRFLSCLSICLSVDLSIHPPVRPPSIHPSIHPSTTISLCNKEFAAPSHYLPLPLICLPLPVQSHLQAQHFLCQEPECIDCMTAFGTEDELRQHMLQVGHRQLQLPQGLAGLLKACQHGTDASCACGYLCWHTHALSAGKFVGSPSAYLLPSTLGHAFDTSLTI